MSYKDESKEHAERRVDRVRRACGGEAEMRHIADAAVTKGVHEHERHDHKGEKETHLKLAGKGGKKRLDRARGGRARSKPTEVNIVIDAAPQSPSGMLPVPPMAMAPPAPMPPPHPPTARPPMPMGAMAGARPPVPGLPVRKRGGKVADMDAGAGSGIGRLEKAAEYGART